MKEKSEKEKIKVGGIRSRKPKTVNHEERSVMNNGLIDEEKKLRRLRFIVDFALEYIKTQNVTHDEAIKVVEGVKKHALKLFPDKEEAFDIIYVPKFKRMLNDKFKRS